MQLQVYEAWKEVITTVRVCVEYFWGSFSFLVPVCQVMKEGDTSISRLIGKSIMRDDEKLPCLSLPFIYVNPGRPLPNS